MTAVLIMVTRVYLSLENRKRDAEAHDATYDEVYITQEKEDGTKEDVKVDKVCLLSRSFSTHTKLTRGAGIPRPHRHPKPRLPLRTIEEQMNPRTSDVVYL